MPAYKTISVIILALSLASCAPDPRKQAEADATRMQAETLAADAQQRREHEAQIHEQKMQDREAAQAQWQKSLNAIIRTGTLAAQVSVMLLVLSAGVAGLWMIFGTTKAYNLYVHRRAEILADQIALDPRTHTFPILPVRVGKDIIALMNPNDNSVIMFDEKNPADLAKVKTMANVLFAGELAHQARLSHRPGEVASIPQTQIIDGE